MLGAQERVAQLPCLLVGCADHPSTFTAESLHHHHFPLPKSRLPCAYLLWTACLLTPMWRAMSCHDQPCSRALCTCNASNRSASSRSAATARNPSAGSRPPATSVSSCSATMVST